VAVPGTSVAGHIQSAAAGVQNYRYAAPEIQWPDEEDEEPRITKQSDVYGMGMIAYEASPYHPMLSGFKGKSYVDFPGLNGGHTVLQV
jgi:hypothetical protein